MGDTEPLVSSGFPGRQSTGGLRGCGRHKSGIGPEAGEWRWTHRPVGRHQNTPAQHTPRSLGTWPRPLGLCIVSRYNTSPHKSAGTKSPATLKYNDAASTFHS